MMRPYIADLFQRMKGPDLREQDAAFDAVLFEREAAVPDLIAAYRRFSEDRLLRFFAVQLLGFSGSKAAVEPLIEALDDPDPLVRSEVCRSLEDLRAKPARAALTARLTDVDGGVREAAREALDAL
ncbi:MAG: HEAT repeat domain-containing protein [Proteobacteria bacterium]|nr:HEAT repeat domain-containing protein [Pseudomonadota bacterium]MCP4919120.1 HEAT repeat domain-containing protein [Pseudomonadota bacterium]